METVEQIIPCGRITGIKEDGVCRFLGIRYAKADRFSYPEEITEWKGVFDATQYGDAPLQKDAFDPVDCSDPKNFFAYETMNGVCCRYSEDCLNLNIWAPENAENAPVLLSIFGGGEVTGRTQELQYDGTALAKKGVIVVFINYRLNIFGFLALRALTERDGKSGNYAYYDQQTAITWVRHNIRAFGGDPNNLTIAGQSAGAANAETQIKSPLNKGVFRQAILQSSAGFTTGLKAKDNREKEYRKWQRIYDRSRCGSLKAFTELPAETLFRLYEAESSGRIGYCTTIYDEAFGSKQRNEPCDTTVMIGITSQDVMPLVLHYFSNVLHKSQEKVHIPTYRYYFQRQLPGDDYGAWHGSDLWYFYGALQRCWRPFTEEDFALADAFQNRIVRFMTCGNPSDDNVQWLPVGASRTDYMVLDADGCRMGHPGLKTLFNVTFFAKYPGI